MLPKGLKWFTWPLISSLDFHRYQSCFSRASEPGRSAGELVVPHLRCFWDGFLNQIRFPEFRLILKQLNVINQWVNKVLIGSVVYPKLSDLSHIFFKVKPHCQKTPPRVMERRKSIPGLTSYIDVNIDWSYPDVSICFIDFYRFSPVSGTLSSAAWPPAPPTRPRRQMWRLGWSMYKMYNLI